MHMFFAGVAKGGRPLTVEQRQGFIDTVRSEVVFCAHVKRVVHVAPTPSSIVVGISNEPGGGWYETWRRHTFLCGYCVDKPGLSRLEVTPTLAEEASQVAGRFSVLVVDKRRGHMGLATQPARIDSIFAAENDRFWFFGNQASVLSALRDGVVRYAPGRMLTFLNSGFFAHDDTPYEGVRCVNGFTTIEVKDGKLNEKRTCLSTLRTGVGSTEPGSHEENSNSPRPGSPLLPEHMLHDFVNAFASLKPSRCELGLTGGMDSRLILAGAVAAKLDVESYTCAYGDANRADVWVAQRIAQLAKVGHHAVDTARFMVEGATPFVKLRQTALWTLVATDGMLGCQYPVEPFFVFSPTLNLEGTGGEMFRGGYGEHIARAKIGQVVSHMQHLWNHSPQLFHADLVAEQNERVQAFVRSFPKSVQPADMLDYLYVDVRCGRWTAAATSASTSRVRPLLDNLVVRHTLRIHKRTRQRHLVHRELIESLFPAAKGFPLANKFWHGTSTEEREAIQRTWPQAFTEAKKAIDQTSSLGIHTSEEEAAIKQYVVDAGRLSLFADILRIDEVRRYLQQPPPNDRYYNRFLKSLFSAAVLMSEPWRDLRNADVEMLPKLGVPTR